METKHTPGPWKVCGLRADSEAWRDGNIISDVTYDTIALCNKTASTVMLDGQLEANARLIAAAPELLEALKALLAYDEQDAGCIPSHAHLDAQEDARAAIVKATGEA